jgi:biopolymer transport protein ExbB
VQKNFFELFHVRLYSGPAAVLLFAGIVGVAPLIMGGLMTPDASGLAAQTETPNGAPNTKNAGGTAPEAGADSNQSATQATQNPDETEDAAETPDGAVNESIFTVIYKGGWTMLPLALISTIIVAFSLERWFYFRNQQIDTRGYYERITAALDQGGLDSVEQELSGDKLLISKILLYGLKSRARGMARVEKEIESAATVEIGKLERGLNLLANMGNLAPLLGFFGTVVGMRASFLQFVAKAAPTAQDLAAGVEAALITTAAGLLIAIPTYLVHNLFIYYIDNFTMEVERSASALTGEMQ